MDEMADDTAKILESERLSQKLLRIKKKTPLLRHLLKVVKVV